VRVFGALERLTPEATAAVNRVGTLTAGNDRLLSNDGQLDELYGGPGFDTAVIYAIRPQGAKGDVSKSHVAWTIRKGAPNTPSPLVAGEARALAAGEVLGVLGESGSGKTTLGLLLSRLWNPPPDTVFVAGHDVRVRAGDHAHPPVEVQPEHVQNGHDQR